MFGVVTQLAEDRKSALLSVIEERREAHSSACHVTASKIPRLGQTLSFGQCVDFRGGWFPFSLLPLVCQGSWSSFRLRSVAVAGAGLKPTSYAASRVGVIVLVLVRETAADGPSPT